MMGVAGGWWRHLPFWHGGWILRLHQWHHLLLSGQWQVHWWPEADLQHCAESVTGCDGSCETWRFLGWDASLGLPCHAGVPQGRRSGTGRCGPDDGGELLLCSHHHCFRLPHHEPFFQIHKSTENFLKFFNISNLTVAIKSTQTFPLLKPPCSSIISVSYVLPASAVCTLA